MDSSAGSRDLNRWIALDGHRPPRAFSLFFQGPVAVYAVFIVQALFGSGPYGGDGQGAAATAAIAIAALLLSVAMWPLLTWDPAAPARRKAAAVPFLAAVLGLVAVGGGIPAFLLNATAVGYLVVVFGSRAAAAFTALAGAVCLALHLSNPAQTVWGALFETMGIVFLCGAVMVVTTALTEAHRKSAETGELLGELRTAHAELRRRAELSRELTVAEERARMAREMHDSVGHYLTVINMGLANAQRFRSARPDDAWEEVRQAQSLTQEALTDTRRWVRALKPLRLKGRAGPDAMAALADSFTGTGVDVAFRVEGAPPALAENAELVCYRALQEGCTNALRHSGARTVRAVLARSGSGVALSIRDDGRGADSAAVGDGFGLRGLRERAAAEGGTLTARNRPEGGFELLLELPGPGDRAGAEGAAAGAVA
ncbi:signal transduction histidine kinase [Murinocardiopsis flavida]|uniref:histidine kinase n=1 Tax=Murinocardiopsis flavida TaxID=645275 RepID=A0A2P8DKS8_9ACTN|nr:sensor histidine kinase [Murinocardiopsis flavida]PSK97826.1 signal transduction histidine kinase [Murinocardiopsis flavida]